jgi:steroid 5-alpha reductase family enzyme
MARSKAAVALVALAYLVAGGTALVVGWLLGERHPLIVAGAADLAATLVVFSFSVAFGNSSFYDPFWSAAPPLIALYYFVRAWDLPLDDPFVRAWDLPLDDPISMARVAVVVALVFLWGARLTHNWLRGWRGLDHEDWRYVRIRQRSGRLYWPTSLAGIHLMPTIVVFCGCLPLYPALSNRGPLGILDGVALVVTGAAIWIEAAADRQLYRFVRSRSSADQILETGLWARCRHPNYLGELLFWWGLYLFGLAAGLEHWWTGLGALSITLLFLFISIPMIERRMLGKPGYAERVKKVPALIPRFSRRGA